MAKSDYDKHEGLILSDDGTKIFKEVFLEYEFGSVDESFPKLLEEVKTNSKIRYIDLRGSYISSENFKKLVEILTDNNTVTKLKLGFCKISVSDIKLLAEATKLKHITDLDLNSNDFGDDGAEEVANLIRESALTSLVIYDCNIGFKGAISISNALRVNQTLVNLDISDNQIKTPGLCAIACALQDNTSLQCLNIVRCGISRTGVGMFAKLKKDNDTFMELISSDFREFKSPSAPPGWFYRSSDIFLDQDMWLNLRIEYIMNNAFRELDKVLGDSVNTSNDFCNSNANYFISPLSRDLGQEDSVSQWGCEEELAGDDANISSE